VKLARVEYRVTYTPCACESDWSILCDHARAALVVEPDERKAAELFLRWKADAVGRWERGGSERYGIICVPGKGHVWSVR
jgi:hypothetical protein